MTNGYSKEDLTIVSIVSTLCGALYLLSGICYFQPSADQVSVMIASLIAETNYNETGRSSALRKISTSSVEKKVSFDRNDSIQEEVFAEENVSLEPTALSKIETANKEESTVITHFLK